MIKNPPRAFSLIELSIVILIIGIIVGGITTGSRLLNQTRLSSAQSQTEASPVNVINDLVFWLEPTLDRSFTSAQPDDQTSISTWRDISPQSTQRNNAVAIYPPKYIKSCINSLPCIRFNGSTQYFEVDNEHMLKPLTFFVAFKISSVTNEMAIMGSSEYGISVTITSSTGYPQFVKQNYALIGQSTTALTVDAATVLTASYSDAGAYRIYRNGSSILSGTNNQTILAQHSFIGFNPLSTNLYFNGDIYEIIVFSRILTTEERRAVESYLGRKWGISISAS